MRTWRWYSKALFALLVAAFAYFVWPTPRRYTKGPGGIMLRVNRFTQRVDKYHSLGWRGGKQEWERY